MEKIITEKRNPNTIDIDLVSSFEIVKKINEEDEKITQIIKKRAGSIALGIDLISNAFLEGGRLFYFGAGTSGRLGVLDASECPPTFGVEPDMVQGIIAGGDRALRYAIEGAEDNFELGKKDGNKLNENDVCVLISASGNPNYLLGVQETAKNKNCKIIAITSNPEAKILENSDIKICTPVGPEVIAGSSRMKSGTAQKMILNMLSTGAMIKIGKTYENFMIDVRATNEKLKKRAVQIVSELTFETEEKAEETLEKCNYKVKTAVVMLFKKVSKEEAENLLKDNNGILRKVIMEGSFE